LLEQLSSAGSLDGRALTLEDLGGTHPVGLAGREKGPEVEVDGRTVDPMRVFLLEAASEVKDLLGSAGIRSAIVPLQGIEFPDGRARFEVRVRGEEYEAAENKLQDVWREQMEREGIEGQDASDVERCPACSAHVPLTAEECPDCGLVIGAGERA
jgi:hypothetical protein